MRALNLAKTVALAAVLGVSLMVGTASASEDTKIAQDLNLQECKGGVCDHMLRNTIEDIDQAALNGLSSVDFQVYKENIKPLDAKYLLPLVDSPVNSTATVQVKNPTSLGYFIEVPDKSLKLYVPNQSERTLSVDLSGVGAGDVLVYNLLDLDGNKLASGYILNGNYSRNDKVASASKDEYADWGRRLDRLILANKYVPPVFEDDEPVAYKPKSEWRSVVRGHW
jgi:hypothetical protein